MPLTDKNRRRGSAAKPRKTRAPKQARAQETVAAILQATRDLAVRVGLEGVTTNAIAERAGVSIGSLYQYFTGLEDILSELSRRHVDEVMAMLMAEVAAIADAPVDVGVRRLVELMIDMHRRDPELHRAIQASLPGAGARVHLARVEQELMRLAVTYLTRHREHLTVDDLERAAFISIASIEAVIHNAVVFRPELLEGTALVDDTSRLIVGYLLGHGPAR